MSPRSFYRQFSAGISKSIHSLTVCSGGIESDWIFDQKRCDMKNFDSNGKGVGLLFCSLLLLAVGYASPPPNDDFANSIHLEGTNVFGSGVFTGATRETGEPVHRNVSIFSMTGESVWWSWVPPFTGRAYLSYGSIFHRQLGVYTGARVDQLQRVYLTPSTEFKAEQGQVYHFGFERVVNGATNLDFQLTLAPFGTNMPNDNYETAAESGFRSVNFAATREPAEPVHRVGGINKSLWWRYRVPHNCQVSIRENYGTLRDVTIAVYTGAALETLTLVAKGYKTNGVFFSATGGDTYYIAAETATELDGDIEIVCGAGTADQRTISTAGNLVFNPSFEAVDSGWVIEGSWVGYVGTGTPLGAADGKNYIYCYPWARVSQIIPTEPGSPYRVKLAAKSYSDGSQITIGFGGQETAPLDIPRSGNWEWPEHIFLATSNSAQLSILSMGDIAFDKITVVPMNRAPQMIRPPAATAVFVGGTAFFVAGASGSEPLFRQWLFNGQPLSNQTASVLEIAGATLLQSGDYQFLVTNQFGAVTSAPAHLTVEMPTSPAIIMQPQSRVVREGEYVCLGVAAVGTAPLRYQWFKDAQLLPGQTNRNFVIPQFSAADTGNYAVNVVSYNESVTSLPALLSIAPTNAGGGLIYFANRQNQLGLTNYAPVYDVDGIIPLFGDGFLAQLYASAGGAPLHAVGQPQPFLSGFQAGYISPVAIMLPDIGSGVTVQAQMRVWDSQQGSSFEEVQAWGGRIGASSILIVTTAGVSNTSPAGGLLLGLQSFALHNGLPEYRRGRLQLVESQSPGTLIWELLGQPGANYLIERQTDGANWQPFLQIANPSGRVQFSDVVTNAASAYRAQFLP